MQKLRRSLPLAIGAMLAVAGVLALASLAMPRKGHGFSYFRLRPRPR